MTELEALRAVAEAARPLVEAANVLYDETNDRDEIWEMPAAMAITAGNLRQIRDALAALDAAEKDDGWVEKIRDGLYDIVGSVDGCPDAPRDPTSLPQMIKYEANRLLGLLPPPPRAREGDGE